MVYNKNIFRFVY